MNIMTVRLFSWADLNGVTEESQLAFVKATWQLIIYFLFEHLFENIYAEKGVDCFVFSWGLSAFDSIEHVTS